MSRNIFWIGLLMFAAPTYAQNMGQGQETSAQQVVPRGDSSAPSGATEGRVIDEGQVQAPREGQVESVPEGHVEAINPTGVQPGSRDTTEADLFRFESRLFRPIPSDE